MVQTVEVTELAKKLGINPISVTTGDLKGRPSPIVPYDMRDEEMLEALLDDYLDYFLGLVKERRKLSEESIAFIRDGRVVNGMRAVELGLVDTLGDEQTALDWLKKERKIDEKLKIKDVEPESDEKNLFDYLSESAQTSLTQSLYRQSGLMAYHKPVQPLQ
jgi:protease-4